MAKKFSLSRSSSKYVSSIGSSGKDEFIAEDAPALGMTHTNETEFNRVNCLVYVLHESARSFSLAIQNLELSRSVPELSNAWNGVDVNAWHKRIAYRVAVYALLKAAIEVELFLCHKRCNTPVYKILSPKALYLGEFVENQLNAKNSELVQWFRMVELPRIAGLFIPLFKKWSVEYAGSGIAGIILAISCCSAVTKLGSGRFSCPEFSAVANNALAQLRDLACDLASVDKLHHLSIEAGVEDDFLSHFGKKVIPSKSIEDVEFWIGLVQEKLSVAFHRESVITPNQTSFGKVEETTLSTLGLFAYLGRETRLYLSGMNIKDMDDQIKNFLGYLECGSLYIYPEFNSLPRYQLFTEVVIDEIGWLDFYARIKSKFRYDGRRSRQRVKQAEKEIILYTVLTVCYDVFSGFAHYSSSSKQPLDSDVLSFLLKSQNLLSSCLEEYWAAYDKSDELMKFTESILLEAQLKPIELTKRGTYKDTSLAGINNVKLTEKEHGTKTKRLHERLWRNSTEKLISARNVFLMGTHLLFIDVSELIRLLVKQLRGKKITSRERRKIKRTLNDIVTLVPVTILMLIPVGIYFQTVSAVGHAAILAAINKYVPSMIPSPYSSERLNLVRQLKRTKKMEVESRVVEDTSQFRESTKESEETSFQVAMP
ncbi:LETM1-like protein [Artemisia annua]|uniref:LETM1-like protein n=1 Tax=Artemisia annua TaxID=35608 RepID=A0A2U1PU88_ARTAN|nr:LETM1-like protein [Artemisia annua]